ncbi:SgcJ/EcaC family oxidoreductase [Streptomyces sp. ML-6]|uniref:SgcJ/EcaC family oxidoreductase n=1 Tax=unclassified Streptomyces TaxID=2593676 RepID=UPI0024C013F3|nr:SgcJ/EcaC family oxidoreductase [Streptomyces sp. ML-6]MDK0524339.1 SgcJ/EcaC family oxidoreductase [Streptomyces sp. ML-6]
MNRKIVKRAVLASTLALVLGATGAYLYLDVTSDVQRIGAESCAEVIPADADRRDGKAVCATLDALSDAWERGDAEAYGRQFTEDGTYTTYIGSHYEGRADITASHHALFNGFLKGSKLAARYLDMRFLTKDVAVLTSRGADYTGDEPDADELSKVTTFTLVRETDGAWRIGAFHNTERSNVMERFSFLYAPDTAPKAEK